MVENPLDFMAPHGFVVACCAMVHFSALPQPLAAAPLPHPCLQPFHCVPCVTPVPPVWMDWSGPGRPSATLITTQYSLARLIAQHSLIWSRVCVSYQGCGVHDWRDVTAGQGDC